MSSGRQDAFCISDVGGAPITMGSDVQAKLLMQAKVRPDQRHALPTVHLHKNSSDAKRCKDVDGWASSPELHVLTYPDRRTTMRTPSGQETAIGRAEAHDADHACQLPDGRGQERYIRSIESELSALSRDMDKRIKIIKGLVKSISSQMVRSTEEDIAVRQNFPSASIRNASLNAEDWIAGSESIVPDSHAAVLDSPDTALVGLKPQTAVFDSQYTVPDSQGTNSDSQGTNSDSQSIKYCESTRKRRRSNHSDEDAALRQKRRHLRNDDYQV